MSHDQSKTNPYRKVSVATWTDRKVMNLSPLQPSGQALFLMLMVGPQTTNIPGIQPVGRMAFAEMLGWELEAFDQAFEEAFREGLAKADWKARLIFVPNAIKHNLPQSPNVVKSWGPMWVRVPDCPLKTEAWNVLHEALCALGDGFANAFKSACPLKIQGFAEDVTDDDGKPSDKATGKASEKPIDKATDNQEAVSSKQEVIPPPPPKGGGRRTRIDPDEEPEGFAAWYELYRRKDAKRDAISAWRQLNPDGDLQAKMLQALQRWRWSDDRTKNPLPATWIRGTRWNDEAVTAKDSAGGAVLGHPIGSDEYLMANREASWWSDAGFPNVWEAANAGCWHTNAHKFRDGRLIPAPQEAHA